MVSAPSILNQNLHTAANALKALGHPIRLDIVISLENYEMSVNTLVEVMETKQYALSKHLKILLDADIIKLRRDGRTHYYSLKNPDYTNLITQLVAERL
jgi:DNA-binding transcriptional ArsR family regulator